MIAETGFWCLFGFCIFSGSTRQARIDSRSIVDASGEKTQVSDSTFIVYLIVITYQLRMDMLNNRSNGKEDAIFGVKGFIAPAQVFLARQAHINLRSKQLPIFWLVYFMRVPTWYSLTF